MKTLAVIYWSGTGNTKLMAEAVAQGAGAGAKIFSVADITPEEALTYDALALGCPAMGAEVLEEYEFEPFFAQLEAKLQGKSVGLFGSYGWGGSYMQEWETRVQADGAILAQKGILALGEADAAVLQECEALGKVLTA